MGILWQDNHVCANFAINLGVELCSRLGAIQKKPTLVRLEWVKMTEWGNDISTSLTSEVFNIMKYIFFKYHDTTKIDEFHLPEFNSEELCPSNMEISFSPTFSSIKDEFFKDGANIRARDMIKTSKQDVGCAICPEHRAKVAWSLLTLEANVDFSFSNFLIRFSRRTFSSASRFNLREEKRNHDSYTWISDFRATTSENDESNYFCSRSSTYSCLRRLECWAEILLRIFLRIRFNCRCCSFVRG